jgi:hypothetical protein
LAAFFGAAFFTAFFVAFFLATETPPSKSHLFAEALPMLPGNLVRHFRTCRSIQFTNRGEWLPVSHGSLESDSI